jgi:hypothetical protein
MTTKTREQISDSEVINLRKSKDNSGSLTYDIHIDSKSVKHTTKGAWYNARLSSRDGEIIACSTEPLFAACRELVKRGITGHVRKFRDGMLCAEGDIEQFAGLTVRENDSEGIRIRQFEPFSRRVQAPGAETPPNGPSLVPNEIAAGGETP